MNFFTGGNASTFDFAQSFGSDNVESVSVSSTDGSPVSASAFSGSSTTTGDESSSFGGFGASQTDVSGGFPQVDFAGGFDQIDYAQLGAAYAQAGLDFADNDYTDGFVL